MMTGQITHDMLATDAALIYRHNVTPEGSGQLLSQTIDGHWLDAETRERFSTIADAESVYSGE